MILATMPLRADDGAASVAAGGVVVMRREPRITMAKEVLQISESKVIVDYDFRNDSDEDIITGVAFPIPDYDHDLDRQRGDVSELGFEDFRLWVNGVETGYDVEARAFLRGTEYSNLLTGMRVDIASFGHARFASRSPDVQKLTAAEKSQLENLGLIDRNDGEPLWAVKKKYYWLQKFPARKTVHIRHEYTPILGRSNSVAYGLGTKGANPDAYAAKELKSFCIDGKLLEIFESFGIGSGKDASYTYVDFILTTANTWKTPIEDFALVVQRDHWERTSANYVSFCWGGAVTKTDADHFSAHATNFVPTGELRVGFFGVRE